MSGHSKWSQIKRQKGVSDVKRGAAFTKVANAITIAVREGGGPDPESNFKLRLTIEKARSINMPKENVTRAIDRALGKGDKGDLHEAVYEGFGPNSVAVMVECVTDNKQRTLGEVTNIFNKNGGTLGQQGTVAYQFKQVGQITIKKDSLSSDDLFSKVVEAGAEDFEEVGDEAIIYTDPGNLKATEQNLKTGGLVIIESELSRKPTITVPVEDKESANRLISFVEKLENLDDVQKVFANFEIPEDLIG